MKEDYDLVSALLAVALCAVLLVTGQQYLLKNPEVFQAGISRQQSVVVGLLPPY